MTDSGRLDYLSRQEFIAKQISPYITGEQWQYGLDLRLASIAISANRMYDQQVRSDDITGCEAPANDKPSVTTGDSK